MLPKDLSKLAGVQYCQEYIKAQQIRDAAPALLEALEDAIKTVEFERHPFRSWHDKARAAIAAAKGEL
jgi:hypothetical protein